MKQGRSLESLSAEILRIRDAKRDFMADSSKVELDTAGGSPALRLEGFPDPFRMTRLATTQLAEFAGVPIKFFDRLTDKYPSQLANTVNAILRGEPSTRFIRTLDGGTRAFLSGSYGTIDNDIAAEAILPFLQGPNVSIESCELTEQRMYIKAVFTDRQTPIQVGDFVQAGIAFSNSEVGGGAWKLDPLIYRLACLNGMIRASAESIRAVHLGARNTESEVAEYFSHETRGAMNKAFMLKVRDTIAEMRSEAFLERLVTPMRVALGEPITKGLVEVMEVTQKRYALTNNERDGILQHLAGGGSMTRFGMVNAITRYAQDVQDYDRATEFERLGGTVLEMPKRDWNALALAA